MYLSNKLTFFLVFSILLVAGFALVPSVMAADGGPTATITIDASPIPAAGANPAIATVDGTNVLLTDVSRTALITDTAKLGYFQVKVKFSKPVFNVATVTDVANANSAYFKDDDLKDAWDIVAGAVIGGTPIKITADGKRKDAGGKTSTTEFLVTLKADYKDLPAVMTLTLEEDKVYGAGTAFQIVDGTPIAAADGIGNQGESATFTIISKPLLKLAVTAPTQIGLDESATVILTFAVGSVPTGTDVPSSTNIKITNGNIKTGGISSDAAGRIWTITVIPQGGIALNYSMKVVSAPGAPFELSTTIIVDSRPPSLQINFVGTPVVGGGTFTVTITYGVAPTTALIAAGITVEGGTKGTFSGSGTTYSLVVDPTDPAPGVTGMLTVRVGQDSKTFQIPGTDVITTTPTATSRITSDAIKVPANSFVIVVKDASLPIAVDATATPPVTVAVPLPEGHVFRAGVERVSWSAKPDALNAMPNLQEIFDRTAIGGGGAIVVEDAGAIATIAVGTVGISEIMWGIDEGNFGLASETASQWIELHNLSSANATIKLHSLTGLDITNDSKLTGDLAAPTIDVVANFFNNRPGSPAWDVPGSNGNTVSGASFASTARILPHKKDAYVDAGGARYSNRDGRASGHWTASSNAYVRKAVPVGDVQVVYEYKGTPGQVNSFKPVTQPNLKDSRTGVASNTIVINEVANRSDASARYEWIELRNVSDGEINLRKYRISKVINSTTDQLLIDFPNNNNAKVAKGAVILLVASNPAEDQDHPLAVGYNVDKPAEEQAPGLVDNPVRYKVIPFQNGGLPDGGEFVLILRRPDNAGKNDPAELGADDLDKIVDIAGYHSDLAKSNYSNAVSSTKLWPLRAFDAPSFAHNKLAVETVHRRQRTSTHNDRSGVGAYKNNSGEGDAAFHNAGFTGVGYKRRITSGAAYEGTPGYDNGILKGAGGDITGPVYISEIMYADDKAGALPQWIELYNPSKTAGANLHNWRLTIVNHDTTNDDGSLWEGKGEASVLLNNMKIDPNSTVLITSRKGPRSEVHMPNADIFALFPAHRSTFGMTSINDDVINTYGFKITLHANGHEGDRKKWQLVDEVGNLADPTSDRRGNRERFDPVRWAWPNAINADGHRSSIARKTFGGVGDGETASSWILSSKDGRTNNIDFVYYGKNTDKSTPGQTVGQPLPVSLSYFRPTLENGEIVIRWTTESELDNAGFNILRSDSRDGEFKQVNSELVQGAGTTGERNAYKLIDESAKPGVIYYYQIEDVSFAGEHQTLTTTKLKGLISAKNKLTTLWGGLKEVQ